MPPVLPPLARDTRAIPISSLTRSSMVFGGIQCNASIETGRYAVLAKFGILDSKRTCSKRFRIKRMPLNRVTFDLLSVQEPSVVEDREGG